MGKGRDKRKKHEDPSKAAKRASRQAKKMHKTDGKTDGEQPEGFNNEEAPEVTLNRIRKQESKTKTTFEEEGVSPPSPRANVIFEVNPVRDNELMIFGGEFWDGEKTIAYNDLYLYHLKRNAWSRVVTAVNPPPRSSSQGIVYKHYLIVFGGEFVSQSQSQFLHFKDVWRFDTRRFEWEEMKTLKGGPSSRSGHRMCLWRRNAVVFGGFYDNAQECHYFNDLWVLSHLDGAGKWTAVQTAPHGDAPHPRSGHCMAIHNDTLFVYGGYSTEKFNRFKKSQATVHHDLWMIKLPPMDGATAWSSPEQRDLPVWIKVRLGGIPPPIRCGMSCASKDKKMYLFGGVVDIESPGGKVVSSFNNDLFIFHMDSKRFYPVVFRSRSGKNQGIDGGAVGERHGGGDLQAELRALQLQPGANSDDDDDEEESDGDTSEEEEAESAVGAAAGEEKDSREMRESFETNRRGQIFPHRRMEASLLISGNTLYVFGGQFESGNKEITMSDLFSLNIHTCETYRVLLSQDLSKAVWLGKEAESATGSWESGSTVVSAAFDLDDYEEEEEEREAPTTVPFGAADDGDEAPDAIPAELDTAVTPPREEVDGFTSIRGKKGLQLHKERLLAQLRAGAAVPTPTQEESSTAFFGRTRSFWVSMAEDSFTDAGVSARRSERRIEKEAMRFAARRYEEARELLEQLRRVEEREKAEAKYFREMREQKEKEWEEHERQLAAQEAESDGEKEEEKK